MCHCGHEEASRITDEAAQFPGSCRAAQVPGYTGRWKGPVQGWDFSLIPPDLGAGRRKSL